MIIDAKFRVYNKIRINKGQKVEDTEFCLKDIRKKTPRNYIIKPSAKAKDVKKAYQYFKSL